MKAFRWGLTVITVAVVTGVVLDWLHLRQQLHTYAFERRQEFNGGYSNYVIVHTNSSLQTHLFLAALVALGIIQIAIVWTLQARLAARLWVPPVVELVLCVSFGFAALYAAGHYLVVQIAGESYVIVHSLHYTWLALWAGAGLLIGFLWTLSGRPPPATELPDQLPRTLVPNTSA
jgi:hypothetical protein